MKSWLHDKKTRSISGTVNYAAFCCTMPQFQLIMLPKPASVYSLAKTIWQFCCEHEITWPVYPMWNDQVLFCWIFVKIKFIIVLSVCTLSKFNIGIDIDILIENLLLFLYCTLIVLVYRYCLMDLSPFCTKHWYVILLPYPCQFNTESCTLIFKALLLYWFRNSQSGVTVIGSNIID